VKCPNCKTPDLVMADRQGIEIDYCPQCRGVWLDRGELDKLIERNAPREAAETHGSRPREHFGERKRRGGLRDFFDFD
jgi:Zn-finger nucleic acid-binding protein